MVRFLVLVAFVDLLRLCFSSWAVAGELIGPDEWLIRERPPHFRSGHTLPLLTRYGWTLPLPVRRILAEKFGYALEFSGYVTKDTVRAAFNEPNSPEAQALKLAAEAPATYKLSLILSRDMPGLDVPGAWVRRADGTMPDEKNHTWSPVAPDAALDLLVEERVAPIGPIVDVVKPAVILNGGEYGIEVLGHALPQWRQDPSVLAAKGSTDWFAFISEMKAREQLRIFDAVKKRVGTNFLYVYYTNGPGVHRERDRDWEKWTYDYKYMRQVGSLPSEEYYYLSFNEGWERDSFHWPGQRGDLLTQALGAKGFEIAGGDAFSYDWVTAGWHRNANENVFNSSEGPGSKYLSRIDTYTGFLKCIYLAGTVGANAGYYAYPKGGFSPKFAAEAPPHWLVQLTALSYVHALFSQLEPFIRHSHLLEGPNRHLWANHPAYEFPTGKNNLRVLVRKHDSLPAWLLIAWSATGEDLDGEVDIPGRGPIRVVGDAAGRLVLLSEFGPGEELTETSVEALAASHPNLFQID